MDPKPRFMRQHLCLVPNFRYFKAGSPSRHWIITPKSSRGLPPQYPYRRGSVTPISSLAMNNSPTTPNRSRSLDGLIESEPTITALAVTEEMQNPSRTSFAKGNGNNTENDKTDEEETETCTTTKQRFHSMDDILDNSIDSADLDKTSVNSNQSDPKRKRNFMDRCVNKVRSLIKI